MSSNDGTVTIPVSEYNRLKRIADSEGALLEAAIKKVEDTAVGVRWIVPKRTFSFDSETSWDSLYKTELPGPFAMIGKDEAIQKLVKELNERDSRLKVLSDELEWKDRRWRRFEESGFFARLKWALKVGEL